VSVKWIWYGWAASGGKRIRRIRKFFSERECERILLKNECVWPWHMIFISSLSSKSALSPQGNENLRWHWNTFLWLYFSLSSLTCRGECAYVSTQKMTLSS
jgi:hypothetical protein